MNLTSADYKFAEGVKLKVREWMQPVPFFILFPSSIHEDNRMKVTSIVEQVLADETFKTTLVKDGMSVQKLEYITKGVSAYELWKRGWMMRGQWVLQILALILLGNIVWTILS